MPISSMTVGNCTGSAVCPGASGGGAHSRTAAAALGVGSELGDGSSIACSVCEPVREGTAIRVGEGTAPELVVWLADGLEERAPLQAISVLVNAAINSH